MDYKVIKSTDEYQGRNFSIKRVHIRWDNGTPSDLDILEHPGSAVIIPLDDNGNILFVLQRRYAVGKDLLELPAGTLEKDEDPAHGAARELREETGFAADKLEKIGDFYLAPGYSTEFMRVYLARELRHDPLEADADEFLSVEKIPLAKALQMAEGGKIPDAKSLAALLLAIPHLK